MPKSMERQPHSQLMKAGVLCGNPERSWSDNRGVYHGAKWCEDCDKLKNTRRSCLKCDAIFAPGCAAKHVCPRCVGKGKE